MNEMSDNKTNINWYPGHMAKTKREIIEHLKLVDIIVELLDARIPIASQNPDFAKLTQNKKKVIVLNKTDLSDNNKNEAWKKYFKTNGEICVLTDGNLGKGINDVVKAIEDIMKEDLEKYTEKGYLEKSISFLLELIFNPNVCNNKFNSFNTGNS